MSCLIRCKDLDLWMANREFFGLIDFALEVAPSCASKPEHEHFIAELQRKQNEEFYPGCMLDVEETFSSTEEKKFWCTVFHDVGRAIFLREIGNRDVTFWQTRYIFRAVAIGHCLTEEVRVEEPSWSPDHKDSREANKYYEQFR